MRARVQNTLQTDTALFKQAHSIFSFCFFPSGTDLGIYFILLFDLIWLARAWGRHKLYIFWVFFCFSHSFIFFFSSTPIALFPIPQIDSHHADKVGGNLYNAPEKKEIEEISQPHVLHCPRRDK